MVIKTGVKGANDSTWSCVNPIQIKKEKKSIALGPKANKGNIQRTKEQINIQNSNK